MLQFVAKLNEELSIKLNAIHLEELDVLKKHQKSIEHVKSALNRLKHFISTYQFKSPAEEIHFFKEIKPEVLSKLIYYNKIFNIEIKRPIGSFENQRKHLSNELEKLTVFFNDHIDFYQYYRMDSTSLDDEYFTRGKKDIHLCQEGLISYTDSDFSTSHDFLVANIKANYEIEVYIKNELDILTIKEQNPNCEQLGIFDQIHLQWTDSKTSLIELIYALYATGSINNGQKDLRELTEFFGKAFNVKLTDIYRTYSEIKIRSNPTKYLDILKTAFLKKINEEL